MRPHLISSVYQEGNRVCTRNSTPGQAFFDERLIKVQGIEYREWDPKRSKLAAALAKGLKEKCLKPGDVVLYLGAAHGYTASFVSDIVGSEGLIFGVDPAPRVMRDLVFLAEKRKNIVPMLSDANHPDEYVDKVCLADVVYQDIAQRNQADIFLRNCALFLKKGGYGLLAIKARSIDVRKNPRQLFEEVKQAIAKKMQVIEFLILEPYQKDHAMVVVRK